MDTEVMQGMVTRGIELDESSAGRCMTCLEYSRLRATEKEREEREHSTTKDTRYLIIAQKKIGRYLGRTERLTTRSEGRRLVSFHK